MNGLQPDSNGLQPSDLIEALNFLLALSKRLCSRPGSPKRALGGLATRCQVDAQGLLHFTEREQRLSWVERATPAAWPLEVPPNVQPDAETGRASPTAAGRVEWDDCRM